MASGAKCFIVNRRSDWSDGSVLKNLKFKNDVLISDNKTGDNGVYISGAFDSMQRETVWHRMRLNLKAPPDAIYRVRLYAADSAQIKIPAPGKQSLSKVNINEYIADNGIDISRKIDMFDYIGAKMHQNSSDVLLYDLKGRYLWVCIEIINYEKEQLSIESMKIEFPQISFVDYLPEIYREDGDKNSFISRFIGIFQSLYVDLEDRIDYTPLSFDIDRTTKDFLNWIGDWLSIKDAEIWGEKRLRELIKKAVKIYKMKGTKRAIAKIVQEYSGTEPIIVEQFDVKENMYYDKQKETVENLFGKNGYVFTVMLPDNYVKDSETYVELLRVINGVKPIDSVCNLVALGNQIYLDHHCYMGINSFISKNQDLVLDKSQHEVNNLIMTNSKI